MRAMEIFAETLIKNIKARKESGKSLPWIRPWSGLDLEFRNGATNRPYSGHMNLLSMKP